jgi:hypothetical protein
MWPCCKNSGGSPAIIYLRVCKLAAYLYTLSPHTGSVVARPQLLGSRIASGFRRLVERLSVSYDDCLW